MWTLKVNPFHRDLGYIAGGLSCDFLKLQSNHTDFAALLQFVTELPGAMRPALVRHTFFRTTQIFWVRVTFNTFEIVLLPAKMHR